MDRRVAERGPAVRRVAQGGRGASHRAGGRQAARHDAVDRRRPRGSPGPRSRRRVVTARTLFDKVWDAHVVQQFPEGPALLYVDLHLVHEVTSPQAFDGLRQAGRRVRRPALTVATVDHNVPTGDRAAPIADPIAARQLEALAVNARDFGLELFDLRSPLQGIVHVIGPELGLTQPGMVIVCGDSHTATHGAFGALALGIGTSEVEHVLATQCLVWSKPGTMEARVSGALPPGVTAKDLILALIGRTGTAGATGHVIEYTGEAMRALSMEERMTVCNMSIEAGARAGGIAPAETTASFPPGPPPGPARCDGRPCYGSPGIAAGEGAGGAGRAGPRVQRGGVRVAQRRMLDVPRHESRRAAERGALCLDVEPQLRRAPGTGWAHPSDEPAHGGGRRGGGTHRGRP